MRGRPNGGLFNPGNLGLYSFGWNNPVVVRDPTGLAGAEGSMGSPTGGSDPEKRAEEAATAAARQAEAQAQAARYRAWFNSLPPDHQAAVRRANAGGAAAATDAAVRKTTAAAQSGGAALTVMAQGAVMISTGMISEVAFPSASLMSMEEEGGASALSDSALVCRGGACTAERFSQGSGVTVDASGQLQGVSVNSAPEATLEQLTSTIPNKQVGVSTVGKIRAAGGKVIPDPRTGNPYHCTMCGVTPSQAEELFTPTVRNPSVP